MQVKVSSTWMECICKKRHTKEGHFTHFICPWHQQHNQRKKDPLCMEGAQAHYYTCPTHGNTAPVSSNSSNSRPIPVGQDEVLRQPLSLEPRVASSVPWFSMNRAKTSYSRHRQSLQARLQTQFPNYFPLQQTLDQQHHHDNLKDQICLLAFSNLGFRSSPEDPDTSS